PLRDAVLDRDPTYGPTFALLDEAAAVYPRVARGETTGEQALFQKVAIWTAYFNNTNPFYALNNRLAAQVAAARLPAGGGRVLEVGAGLGSGTEALLGRLQAMGRLALVTAYHVTEPVPFFRRRAQRALDAAWPAAPWPDADRSDRRRAPASRELPSRPRRAESPLPVLRSALRRGVAARHGPPCSRCCSSARRSPATTATCPPHPGA